jgi:hypothetical protein
MSGLLTTLIDIVRLAAVCNEDQSALKVAPARAILADICAPYLSPAQIEQLADALVACAEGRSDTLPSLDAIEPALVGAEIEDRLSRASLALNELLALHYALRTGAGKLAHLKITGTYLFDYLQECYIDPAPGQPSVVLIGAWLPPQGEVTVELNPRDRLLGGVAISYRRHSYYPYLTLWLESSSVQEQWTGDRANYMHQAGSQYDLTLSHRGKILGTLRTCFLNLPYTIEAPRLGITVSDTAEINLLETSILDTKTNKLATYLRVVKQAFED